MVRKLLLKNDQASSTDGMRSIYFQDTQDTYCFYFQVDLKFLLAEVF
jgi:hypothetical protein